MLRVKIKRFAATWDAERERPAARPAGAAPWAS